MTNITINATIETVRAPQTYVVYGHADPEDGFKIKYLGVTTLTELFTFSDAKCNSAWEGIFMLPGKTIQIAVISTHETEQQARLELRQHVAIMKPICNVAGYWISPDRQNILCIETDEVFRSLRECANAHGIATSNLSNHLNNKPGHITVKGRTYKRTVRIR